MAVVNSRDFWLNLFFRSLFYHCTNIYIYKIIDRSRKAEIFLNSFITMVLNISAAYNRILYLSFSQEASDKIHRKKSIHESYYKNVTYIFY